MLEPINSFRKVRISHFVSIMIIHITLELLLNWKWLGAVQIKLWRMPIKIPIPNHLLSEDTRRSGFSIVIPCMIFRHRASLISTVTMCRIQKQLASGFTVSTRCVTNTECTLGTYTIVMRLVYVLVLGETSGLPPANHHVKHILIVQQIENSSLCAKQSAVMVMNCHLSLLVLASYTKPSGLPSCLMIIWLVLQRQDTPRLNLAWTI